MSQVANFGFATEVATLPITASQPPSHARRPQGGTPYQKLRQMRDKVRQASVTFQEQVVRHHKARRSLQEVTRKSLIKRMEFLKIYGNKKSKYQHKELLEGKRREEENADRRSVELVRRRKLENELHHILVQNEEEDHVYRLQSRNRQQNEKLRQQLEATSLRERSLLRHDAIRKGNTDFLIRKKNIETSVSMRSRHNYYSKVHQELAMIKQYEDIMTEIENFATLQGEQKHDDASTLFRTVEAPSTAFVTLSSGKPPSAA